MPTLWAQTVEYANISVGDDLPILVKFEFRMPVKDGADPLTLAAKEEPVTEEKLTAYIKELLLKAFPPESVNDGKAVIETEMLSQFLPGDTISVCGRVTGKSDEGGRLMVECGITVESEAGGVLAKAGATISF